MSDNPKTQDWRRPLSAQVAAIYTQDPRVVAVALGGSVARGQTDCYSDGDIYGYCRQLPSAPNFTDWARRLGGQHCKCYGDAESIWGHFYFDRFMVDVKLTLVAALEKTLDDVLVRFDTDPSKHFTLGGIVDCLPLYGRPLIEAWQQRAAHYPPELADAQVRQNLWFGPHWYLRPMLRDRGEVLYVNAFFHRWTNQIVAILAALNRRYERGDLKGVAAFVEKLPIKPAHVVSRLQACIDGDAEAAIDQFHQLIEEIYDLLADHMPHIDQTEARRIFNHPPLASHEPPQNWPSP